MKVKGVRTAKGEESNGEAVPCKTEAGKGGGKKKKDKAAPS